MTKIFQEGEEIPITHTDSYVIRFKALNSEGFEREYYHRYFTCGKGKHKLVGDYFRKRFPKARIVSVSYE